jgi:hypothetical protein
MNNLKLKKVHGITLGSEKHLSGDTMKKSVRIFEVLKAKIHDKEFIKENKLTSKAFLRCRLLPFSIVFLLILNLLRRSIPKELNIFCKYFNTSRSTRSAFTQARAKISSKAYVKLNNILVEEFYKDSTVNHFKDFILLAIDGSVMQLPDVNIIIDKFGYVSNNTSQIMPSARASILYDVLNKIILNASINPYKTGEREMAIEHFEALKSLDIDLTKFLVIFDRGYPSIALMYYLTRNGINYLIRCSTGFIREVTDIYKSNERDVIIKISPKRLKQLKKTKVEMARLFPGLELKEDVVFRVLIVELNNGEKEILLTSLLCKEKYPYNMFKGLYSNRWGVEEEYKIIKAIEIENFSGKTVLAIEQDFHATILALNSHALLVLEAKEEMNESQYIHREYCSTEMTFVKESLQIERKYEYEINKNVSFNSLKNAYVKMLFDPESNVERFCKEIKQTMRHDLIPKRPGRSWKRICKNTRRKYHINQR